MGLNMLGFGSIDLRMTDFKFKNRLRKRLLSIFKVVW